MIKRIKEMPSSSPNKNKLFSNLNSTISAAQCPALWAFVDGKCYRVIVEYHFRFNCFVNNKDFTVFFYFFHLGHSTDELRGIMRPRNLPSTETLQRTAGPRLSELW